MEAQQKANELSKAILQSDEFKKLANAKQIIDKNSESKNKLNELKSKHFNLQKNLVPDQKKSKQIAEQINKHYDEAKENPDIKMYLDAEKNFNDFVSKVFKMVNDDIEKSLNQ